MLLCLLSAEAVSALPSEDQTWKIAMNSSPWWSLRHTSVEFQLLEETVLKSEGGREGKGKKEGRERTEREGEGRMEREPDWAKRERVVISSLLAVSCHDSSLLYNLWSHLAKNVDVKLMHGTKHWNIFGKTEDIIFFMIPSNPGCILIAKLAKILWMSIWIGRLTKMSDG